MAPAAHTSETPDSGDVNNGAAITTGVRFTVDEEVDCAGIAFYVPVTNSGTYTVGLYETTTDDDPNGSGLGDELATDSVASAAVTGGDWAEVLFDPPVTLAAGTVYTAARHASSGRYVASAGAFSSAGISGNGVNLLQDGTDPNPPGLGSMRNGVFHEGAALAYPNSTFGAADYFVDIVLDDGGPTIVPVATAAETDAAVALGRRKSRTLGAAVETDVAVALARAKRRAVATATSTEAALPIGRKKIRTLGPAAETDVALPITPPGVADVKGTSISAVVVAHTSVPAVTAGRTSQPAVSARRTSTATVG